MYFVFFIIIFCKYAYLFIFISFIYLSYLLF